MTRRPSLGGLAAVVPALVDALAGAMPALEALALEETRRNSAVPPSLRKTTALARMTKAAAALALAAQAAQDDGAAK